LKLRPGVAEEGEGRENRKRYRSNGSRYCGRMRRKNSRSIGYGGVNEVKMRKNRSRGRTKREKIRNQ